MELFLLRYDSLKKSKVKGVEEAIASLTKKGLTKELLKHIQTTVDEAKATAPAPKATGPDESAVSKTAEEQLAAYDLVNRWYTDWAETLRTELPYHDAVKLGIVTVKGGRKKNKTNEEEEDGQ